VSFQAGLNAQIVGDGLLVTNPRKITEAIKAKACNALLLKVNPLLPATKSFTGAVLQTETKGDALS
jgi:enolase